MKKLFFILAIALIYSCSDDTVIPVPIEPCETVAASFVSEITDNSIQFNWCATVDANGDCLPSSGTNWIVSYGVAGTAPDSGTMATTSSTSFTITGLTANSSYDFYVKSDCDLANNDWTGPVNARTSCVPPTDLDATVLSQTSATFMWSAGGSEISWEIKYGLAGFNLDEAPLYATGDDSSHTVMDLLPGNNYEFYVRSNCNSATDGDAIGSSSSFAGPFLFTTCLEPLNLVMTDSNQTSVTMDWDSNGETSWEIAYAPTATFTLDSATIATSVSSDFTATGLCPNIGYTFAVRAVCSADAFSGWVLSVENATTELGYVGMYRYEEVANTDELIFGDPVDVEIVMVSDTERTINVKYLANLDVADTRPTMDFAFTLNCDGTVTVTDDQATGLSCGAPGAETEVLIGSGGATPATYNLLDDTSIEINFTDDTGSADCENMPMTPVTIKLTKL